MFSVSAQREGLPLESQARLPNLPGTGTKSAYQAPQAVGTGETRATGGAQGHQHQLVHGLHARPVRGWSQLPAVQCDR